ncbi:MAG: penicillin-binding protein 2, partial [Scardovia wiggsiae]|nr:penicillin-binding protein 2 [Scardovia wiggsiae]
MPAARSNPSWKGDPSGSSHSRNHDGPASGSAGRWLSRLFPDTHDPSYSKVFRRRTLGLFILIILLIIGLIVQLTVVQL